MAKKKPNFEKINQILDAGRLMFEKKLIKCHDNEIKMYSVLIENNGLEFKKNWFMNVYTYCVFKNLVKKGKEIVFTDIETGELLGYCDGNESYFE